MLSNLKTLPRPTRISIMIDRALDSTDRFRLLSALSPCSQDDQLCYKSPRLLRSTEANNPPTARIFTLNLNFNVLVSAATHSLSQSNPPSTAAISLSFSPLRSCVAQSCQLVLVSNPQYQPLISDIITCTSRPISQDRARVTPSDLLAYRTLHDFRAPCCLCAVSTIGGLYTECAIYLAVQGQYTGEYVCGCAFNSCGYLGTLVPIGSPFRF